MLTVAAVRRSRPVPRPSTQLHALVVTAPDQVKHQLRGLSPKARVNVCAGFRPGDGDTTIAYAKHVLRLLARRYQTLTAEIGELDTRIKDLCARANPALLATTGIGPDTAAALLVAAGDNPERMRSESFLRCPCAAPVLSRHPQDLSCAIASTAVATAKPTTLCGGSPPLGCAATRPPSNTPKDDKRKAKPAERSSAVLKRYIARQVYRLLTGPPSTPDGADLRCLRQNTRPPSLRPPQPYNPPNKPSHNSNEASTTTTTSLPDTTNGSPHQTRFDKHRSITPP